MGRHLGVRVLACANVEMSPDPGASVKNLGVAPHRSVTLAMGGGVRTEQECLLPERMPYWRGSLTGCQPSSRFS